MNRRLVASVVALFVCAGIAVAQQQSLGEVAREMRQQKHPTAKKVYTNEDVGFASHPEAAAEAKADAVEGAKAAPKDEAKDKPAGADKAAVAKALQAKADAERAELAQLQRELSVSQREYKLRVANYYADAGNSLRDPKKWLDEQKANEAELAAKQKAIDDAKTKLDDIIEQGRRAGVKVE